MAFSSTSPLLRRSFSKTLSFLPQLYRQYYDFPFTSKSFSTVIPSDDNSNTVPPLKTPKLFISGLSRLTTDEKLKAAFCPYGQLIEANVITDRVTGRSKGFGFIRYSSIAEAEKARQMMNAKFLDGWVIFVDPAKPREPRRQAPAEEVQSETGFKIYKTVGWCG
ncbi:RNA binding protein [Zostera marina]|uniref:RNA binding protein n=1 Tax=Zostera marina TaxID=29655 RepID=A0A0K9PZU9_ZOSMR|nr:RNA binding protein [Zostera marina]